MYFHYIGDKQTFKEEEKENNKTKETFVSDEGLNKEDQSLTRKSDCSAKDGS